MRLFPTIARFLRACLRGFLILSYRFYALLLMPIAQFSKRHLGIDILSGLGRIVVTVSLSLVMGVLFLLLTNGQLTGWIVVFIVLHGLVVGIIWDDIQYPGELQLGTKIQ
jgi:hypothetical protein